MPYELGEHTADVRARCTGATFEEVLDAAADAFQAVAFRCVEQDAPEETREVRFDGMSPDDLLIQWLQELIFLADVERFIAPRREYTLVTDTRLEAVLYGYRYGPDDRETEVKAATWHGVALQHGEDGVLTAEVLFDL